MTAPKDREEACAGLLNGTMFVLLGSVLPAAFLWATITHGWPRASGPTEEFARDAVLVIGLMLGSLHLVRGGVRLLLDNARELRRF